MRCVVFGIACIMALPMFACGKAETETAAEQADVIFDIPEEAMADAEVSVEIGEDEHVVEIIMTPNIEPIKTPVPTPELPQVEECDPTKGYTKKSGVNLREQPTTESDVLDTLDKATRLTITGTAGEWTRVTVDDETGFISTEFVGKGSVPAVLTIDSVKRKNGITTASVNMREEPDTDSDIIEKLKLFTPFTITGENKEWYEVEYEGERGYVSKKYCETSVGYYAQEDLYLVAQLVHQEAKYTTKDGLVAVANVVYNRLRSSRFPNTLEGVVFEEGQFSPAANEKSLRSVRPSSGAVDAVLEVFARGKTILPKNILYFRAARMGTTWSSSRRYYETFGGNCFFR